VPPRRCFPLQRVQAPVQNCSKAAPPAQTAPPSRRPRSISNRGDTLFLFMIYDSQFHLARLQNRAPNGGQSSPQFAALQFAATRILIQRHAAARQPHSPASSPRACPAVRPSSVGRRASLVSGPDGDERVPRRASQGPADDVWPPARPQARRLVSGPSDAVIWWPPKTLAQDARPRL